MKHTLSSFAMLLAFVAGQGAARARTLTDKGGREIVADIISKQGDQVTIRRSDGKVFTLPVRSFSPADETFIKDWQPAAAAKPVIPPKDPDERKYQRLIEDVVFVVEQGDKEPYSKRWLSAPTLVINSVDDELKKFAEATFADVCKEAGLLPGTTDPAEGGQLTIHIGVSTDLNKIVRKDDADASLATGHLYWTWWGDDRALTKAVIYLCTDRLDGAAALDAFMDDMLGAFGLPSKSREFENCCLSKKPSLQSSLTLIDRKVLSFYYAHVPPGTKSVALRRLFKEHWKP